MTKKNGFKIRIDAFLEIDKKDFAKQAAAYSMIAGITETGKLPDGFLDKVTIIGVDAKQGAAEVPDQPVKSEPITTGAGLADKAETKPAK